MHKRIRIHLCIQTYSHTNNILTHKQTYTRVQYKTPTLIGQDVSTELLSLVDVQYSSRTKQALLSLNLHSDLRLDWGEFLFLTMKERVLLIHFVVFHSVPPSSPIFTPNFPKCSDANVHYYNQNQLSTMQNPDPVRSPCHSLHQLWINFLSPNSTPAPRFTRDNGAGDKMEGEKDFCSIFFLVSEFVLKQFICAQ